MKHSMRSILALTILAALSLGCGDEESSGDETMAGEAGAQGGAEEAQGGEAGATEGWNAVCAEPSDCAEPTTFCAKQPGEAEGYCSTPCSTTADCPYGEWSCNVIGPCEQPAATWCGPREETEMFAGIISACD